MRSRVAICHINLARGFRGGERQTELLIHALARDGTPQSLVCRRGSPLARRLSDCPGLAVREIGKPFLRHVGALRRAGLVHAHENKGGRLAFYASGLWGVPYVLTRRVPQVPSRRWPSDRVYRRAARVVAVSRAVGEILEARFPGLDVAVVPDAHGDSTIDPDAAERLHARFPGAFLVGHVAALQDRHKGQRVLIEAAASLAHGGSRARILFVGDGPDAEALRSEAAHLDNVTFLGFVDDVGEILAGLDVAAMPSRYEAMGSALLDAMHAGVPVVASDIGGIPEIVQHEVNGLLVTPNDAGAFAHAIARLERNRELRLRLGAQGRRSAEAYGPSTMAAAYAEIYQSVAAGVAVPE